MSRYSLPPSPILVRMLFGFFLSHVNCCKNHLINLKFGVTVKNTHEPYEKKKLTFSLLQFIHCL